MIVIPASVGAEAGRKSNVGFVAPWMEGCGRPLSARWGRCIEFGPWPSFYEYMTCLGANLGGIDWYFQPSRSLRMRSNIATPCEIRSSGKS